jgi:putative iron-regulated protein
VTAQDPALDAEMKAKLSTTMMALARIKTTAEAGFSYDQMLERGNEAGENLIMGGVNGLVDQTKSFERVVALLGLDSIEFEGSDSLDKPAAVFQ